MTKRRQPLAPAKAPRPRLEAWKASAGLGTLGIEVVVSVLVGLFAGRFFDRWLGTRPYLSVLGFCFGVGAAVKAVFRAWKEMQAITRREEREHGNPAPVYGLDDKPSEPPNGEASETETEESAASAGEVIEKAAARAQTEEPAAESVAAADAVAIDASRAKQEAPANPKSDVPDKPQPAIAKTDVAEKPVATSSTSDAAKNPKPAVSIGGVDKAMGKPARPPSEPGGDKPSAQAPKREEKLEPPATSTKAAQQQEEDEKS
jgi:F0F1-type ATP synthase assembly protein I